MNRRAAKRFFDLMPSKIHLMVSFCPEVDRFMRDPFWFFLKTRSSLGLVLFRNVILGDHEVAFFGDWKQAFFSPSIYGILIIYIVAEIHQ